MLDVVNAYTDYESRRVVLVAPDGSLSSHPAVYSCFVHDGARRDVMSAVQSSRAVLAVVQELGWVRIEWRDRDARRKGCDWMHSQGVQTYEGWVQPVRRLLVDEGVRIHKPRRAYFDIETDSRVPFMTKEETRILCWSLVNEEGTCRSGMLRANTDRAERDLLLELYEELAIFDQVCAWNGNRFDFPVVRARTIFHSLQVEHRRWLWLDFLDLFKRMNMMAAESGEEKASFALDAIATALLGEGKQDFDSSKTFEEWMAGGARRKAMGKYCDHDSDLLRRIEAKKGYLQLFQSVCEVCGIVPDSYSVNPSIQVEGFLLQLAKQRGYKFETRWPQRGLDQYEGAWVMEPKTSGITKNVHVCDFARLYPSIILSWNMSPETVLPAPEGGVLPRPDHVCEAPKTGILFDTRKPGILPFAVDEILRLRKFWSDKQATFPPGTPEFYQAGGLSSAYKITANIFYGVVGSPASPFFDRNVAASICASAAWLIQEVVVEAERRRMTAVYGDTDSVFVTGVSEQEFAAFVQWCNEELFPRLLIQQGCRNNRVELAYEKEFERIVICSAKKYAGAYAHFKGKRATAESKPEVKGLEYKRGDSARLTRALLKQTIDLCMREKCEDPVPFEALAREHKSRILEQPLDLADVVVSKTLSKPIDDYVQRPLKNPTKDGRQFAAAPIHVEVARVLEKRGADVAEGARIAYVVVDGSTTPQKAIPAEDWAGECDRHHLWEKLVWPSAERFLKAAFPAYDWGDLPKSRPKKQRAAKKVEVQEKPAKSWF